MKNPWDVNSNDKGSGETGNGANGTENHNNGLNNAKSIEELAREIFKNFQKQNNKRNLKKDNVKSLVILGFSIVMLLWLLTGIYKVNSDENAVVLYFGKYFETTTPGLHFAIPKPIGKVIKVGVARINKEEFGFSSDINSKKAFDEESLMLTGDENIADIDFEVQWKIGNIEDYLFNIKNPQKTIRSAMESVMREIIANREIDDVLANKKFEIESEARNLLQNILNSYGSGIDVITVQLLRADPPKEVIDAFRDVQTAKADKERKINEAKSYSNDIIPKARGEAEELIQRAEAYKKSIIAKAEGETARFEKIYHEYRLNRDITKKRIYIETMEEVMKNNDKIVMDKNSNRNIIQLLNDK